MRNVLIGLVASSVVACGVFGSDDAPSKEPDPALPPPSTPQDNATPPPAVGGQAPVGIYVSSSQGADDGTGSSARPLKTLAKAFEVAKAKGLRVVACAEAYSENVTLVDGVSAYGYYDCKKTPWEQITARAVIAAPASPAMLAKGITLPTRIEGFEIRSPDLDGTKATDDAGSSIALEVHDSKALVISGSLLHAGRAAGGTDGTDGPLNSRTATSNGLPGADQAQRSCNPAISNCSAVRVVGPAGGTTTCTIGPPGGPGGKGGDGRWYDSGTESTGTVEYRGLPLVATTATAVGGLNASASNIGRGLAGAAGAPGTAGTDGVNGAWSLTANGFARGNGTAGGPGAPGQGGGGSAGTKAWFYPGGASNPPTNGFYATTTGGGGGAGGCGGQSGTPATGGGASIGALVIASSVTMELTRIESSNGGAAGKGNLGTAGTTGGNGGLGTSSNGNISTEQGGSGGAGGRGGASGHGAPGPSIALAWSKTKPTLTQVDLAPGAAGAGQPQLTIAGDTQTLPAVTGESKREHEITQ